MSTPEPAMCTMESRAQSRYGNAFLSAQLCGEDRTVPQADPNAPMSIDDYLALVQRIEAHYQAQAGDGEYDASTTVAGMRSLYGYEGGFWENMIPDAQNVTGPSAEDVEGLEDIFQHSADGARTGSRLVRLPNGDLIDPGHIFTGIDAVQHPDAHWGLDAYGVQNEDGATWSGDVGQALVLWQESQDQARSDAGTYQAPAGALTHDQAMTDAAGVPDLNADLDGVVLGHSFDGSQTLTEQLRSYYTNPDAMLSYQHRYSEFLQTQGMTQTDGTLSADSQEIIREEVDDFAEAFSRRGSNDLGKGWGIIASSFDEDSAPSTEFTDRFIQYLEGGLSRESPR